MGILINLINALMHIDKYLALIIQQYGILTYVILFLIIFIETGLVVMPILPGDSMLFAAGALAGIGSMNIFTLLLVVYLAAILGDTANYHIGKKIGKKILEKEEVRFINKEYLKKAQEFYEKHGSLTIVIARFIPIIRTFAPFVAGIFEMNYSKFIPYNMIGGGIWVSLFLGMGYFFGNLSFVKNHFSYVLIAIIIISLLPGAVVFIKEKRKRKRNNEDDILSTEIR
ncbi:VTT domain-containing protein [Clostridium tagluense]|uniref:VTT domain-containing protein n=1 Tax=Clostridium tagluense TaxID=360422 RepID=UPI001CF2EFDA|nr:VTT domain-containing protein [Clostridium tagluense]MCB2310320.1 VTT domain-containing protein [Clostridium tagluense]MCB2315038.1 VTT domain-containing protein [Clostridium tagluense]MCB2320020.1 VTT domain-containing protein [Clostridium tagluense]MCB2324781.1 VTT domain-containing protein [Clostridium tagluense]MCB2329765.1 VTT domain-containing protein [Clostridium tagluense]